MNLPSLEFLAMIDFPFIENKKLLKFITYIAEFRDSGDGNMV